MTFAACRKCGKIVEMATEEAYTPIWCCGWKDRLCLDCYQAAAARLESTKGGENR